MAAGSVSYVIREWASIDPKKASFLAGYPEAVLRMVNEAQLRFADKSEILRAVWEPTVTATGNIALPTDFLREVPDKVLWTAGQNLSKIPYPEAALIESFGGTYYYSIWDGTFYVWGVAAGTPEIPYIIKPAALTILETDNFEIPTEFHSLIKLWMDAQWAGISGDVVGRLALEDRFDQKAQEAGEKFNERNEPHPVMRANLF